MLRTERYESTQKLAITDPKTDLYNYRYFRALLEEHMVNRTYEKISALMLDVDYFKQVNDQFGHQVGDEVLKQVAVVFSSAVRNTDVAARFGGEEFIAMLPDCDTEEASQVAERIRLRLESYPTRTSVGEIAVTVSLGITSYIEGESAEELISRLDHALYAAKKSGRNRVHTM